MIGFRDNILKVLYWRCCYIKGMWGDSICCYGVQNALGRDILQMDTGVEAQLSPHTMQTSSGG